LQQRGRHLVWPEKWESPVLVRSIEVTEQKYQLNQNNFLSGGCIK